MTMRLTQSLRLLVLATVVAVVTACGKAPEPAASTPAAAGSEATPGVAAPAPAPASDAVAADSAVEESASTEAPAAGDNLGKDIVLAANSAPAAATNWQFKEGEHFNTLTSAQGTSSAAGKIEVAEVFWYGCSHCYNLEPILTEWVKKLPADVSFVRIPVMWNPANEIHGRVYYTAEALGKLDVINPAMFKAIHVENRPLTEEAAIREFFAQNGVSEADFNKTFRSFAVESQLKRAKDLTVKYRVRGVPLLVVDGKYTTDGPKIRSHQDLLAVTEELIQRERQRT
jgi:thiol:disulfide interchange protein DsbA